MNLETLTRMYDFAGRSVVITGGGGILGGEISCALVGCGASLAILDQDEALAERVLTRIDTTVGRAIVVYGDVLKRDTVEKAAERIIETFGRIDCLINVAGGNNPRATTSASQSFFDLPEEALRLTSDLNLLGTIIPCQVVGRHMARQGAGNILNVSSMTAFRPLTRIVAYSAAKAAVTNFTQWLAVYMAQEHSTNIRVNAIAPGFFLTEQNRYLMTEQATGALTERGRKVLEHTPLGRFGTPEDLLGAVLWLLSPASSFVTGTVIPIDGGFSAYSGV